MLGRATVLLVFLMLATPPGFVEVEGGVAQEANVRDSLGWRCEVESPLQVTIEGPALMHVEILVGKMPRAHQLTLSNGGRPLVLDAVPRFSKLKRAKKGYRARTDFALEVAEGPQPFTFVCPPGSLVKLVSVAKVAKNVAIVR